MKLKKVVDPRLIGVGLGVFGATFLSTQVTDFLGEQKQPFVREYARELAGAALTIGGTFLMGGGNKETRTVGLAVGAAGVSTVASGLVRRLQGKSPAAVGGGGGGTRYTNGYASGSTGGGGSTGGFYDGPPVFTAGANGSERGSFQLV